MTKLYKNKFRVKSNRLTEWDYSTPWWYYVTICTKNFKNWFGEIKNGKIILNASGEIANKFFEDIPNHFSNTDIDYFVIMPNHIHGIILIQDSVETRDRVSLQKKFGVSLKNSLSIIVNQYKGTITREIRKNGATDFSWQPRFYDHIIRNDADLRRIRNYIQNNPLKWELDEYYKT